MAQNNQDYVRKVVTDVSERGQGTGQTLSAIAAAQAAAQASGKQPTQAKTESPK